MPRLVTVDLMQPPPTGEDALLVRCRQTDKLDVDKAADLLEMTTAQFTRTVVIQAARRVLEDDKGKTGKDRSKVS